MGMNRYPVGILTIGAEKRLQSLCRRPPPPKPVWQRDGKWNLPSLRMSQACYPRIRRGKRWTKRPAKAANPPRAGAGHRERKYRMRPGISKYRRYREYLKRLKTIMEVRE